MAYTGDEEATQRQAVEDYPTEKIADGSRDSENDKDQSQLGPQTSTGTGQNETTSDATEAALIDHKSLHWWQGGIILIAETVSLGILSLPSVLANLGLVPGVVLILVMSILSTYSCVVLGEFRKQYPSCESFGDAVEIIARTTRFGPMLREIFGWGQFLFQVFVGGSHLLTWTICINTLTNSSTCTIVWAVVGLGIFWVLNLPRTLKYAGWMSLGSCLSIVIATLMTVGDVAANRPIGSASIDIANKVGFSHGFLAVSNIAIAFSSHSCFFTVIGEFREPDDWPKALALLQITDTTLYIIAAVVIYVYVGPDVPAPALSASDSPIMRKAIWGVAIPTIVIAGVIYGHVAARYLFLRIFRNTKHAIRRTKLSTVVWVAITFGIWLLAMIIAESIPVFNSLLSLVAALFVSWFSYGLPGIFWLWMHYGNWMNKGWKQRVRFFSNVILALVGFLLCVLGLWAAIEAIANEKKTKAWTCASNAAE